MVDFLSRLKEKTAKLSKKQKILLSLTIFLIFVALGFFLSGKKRGREEEFVRKAPPLEQVPQPITTAFINKISQFFRGQKVEVEPLEKITPTPTPIPLGPIIREVLEYIETQYRDDGFYDYISYYHDYCDVIEGKFTCPYEGKQMFPQTNAWTSLAFLSGYKALGEQKYLNLAKRDMDWLILHCQNKPRDCLWILVQMAKLYQETNDSKYLDFLKKEGEMLLTVSKKGPMLVDIEPRELAILYRETGVVRFLEEAKKRLVIAENYPREIIYTAKREGEPTIEVKAFSCWTNLANLELYRATQEKQYLEKVKNFFDPVRQHHYQEAFYYLSQSQPCIESLLELAQITGEEKFLNQASSWIDRLISQNWDSKGAKKKYGEGGFLMFPDLDQKPYLNLTDSAYMVYLLARLQDVQ